MALDNFISKKKVLLISAGVLAVVLAAALIVWLGAGDADSPDPTLTAPTVETDDTGQTVPPPDITDPSGSVETDPTEPGETNPTGPGETNPTGPGETNPTGPGETNPTGPGETNPTSPGETDPTEPGETDPTEPGETDPTEPDQTEPTTKPTEPDTTDPTEPDPTEPDTTDPTEPDTTDPTEPDTTAPNEPTPPKTNEEVKLSCDRIAVFSGRFVEDGLDKPAENVAALLVTNRSSKFLDLATIVYEIDGEKATFIVTGLPPGTSCWVMEYTGMQITKNSEIVFQGSSTSFRDDAVSRAEEVTVKVNGSYLTATNNTKETLKDVFIYYKSVHSDGNYFGGITYMVNFGDLKPGETVEKLGGHYSEDSEIVRIGWQEDLADAAS